MHSDFVVSGLIISNVTNNSTVRLSSFQNLKSITIRLNLRLSIRRPQNSPYFCVFKYARAVKQKVWNEAENRERDWGETLKVRLSRGCVRLARFARVRLLRHALPISLLILRKKPLRSSFCFAVLFIPSFNVLRGYCYVSFSTHCLNFDNFHDTVPPILTSSNSSCLVVTTKSYLSSHFVYSSILF